MIKLVIKVMIARVKVTTILINFENLKVEFNHFNAHLQKIRQ